MNPAIFLDRDGVIIENCPDYVRSWDDVQIYPQALEALKKVSRLPYSVVIVTNQSAVGRGIVSLSTAWAINEQLIEEVSMVGGRIDGAYMCPHAPWEACECRKPEPGLFFQAAKDLNLDMTKSLMVGDALSDLIAARSANVARLALVRTGRGAQQEQLVEANYIESLNVYDELAQALENLL
jgi:D-glycero-D-manno-heptose 1,7-bisphosphate phosphatase